MPPFDFSHYFTYAELMAFLHHCQHHYPHLLTLEMIGHSYAGREIPLATLTHQSTGSPLHKPGYWIDANTHAGEVTGSAVALYTIYHLLTHYGRDPQVTWLLDQFTVYVLPRLAVDGAEKYLTTPYHLRSTVRPYPYSDDPEPDGLYGCDINDDGLILEMRIPDAAGAWKISERDPRLMRRRDPWEYGGQYYSVMTEGLIRQFQGFAVKKAPSREALDFNRNYPHEWAAEGQQYGAGDFPFSEPETRAEAEFWRTHPNINGFVTYHTYSAVILRPYSTHPDDHFPVDDLDVFKVMGETATALTGYECISVYHRFRYHPKEVIHGGMDDYGYDHWGWYGFTTELWDLAKEAGVDKKDYIGWYRQHPEADDLQMLRWNDEHLGGQGFINWQPFDHPQLGPVEIGGWDYKKVWQNAPTHLLPGLCQKHCQWTITHALMSPRLQIAGIDVQSLGSQSYRVVLKLENQGFLPTHTSQKALDNFTVKPIRVILDLPASGSLISGLARQEIGHLPGRSHKAFNSFAGLGGLEHRRQVEWVLSAAAGSTITITVQSQRAGTLTQTVSLG